MSGPIAIRLDTYFYFLKVLVWPLLVQVISKGLPGQASIDRVALLGSLRQRIFSLLLGYGIERLSTSAPGGTVGRVVCVLASE